MNPNLTEIAKRDILTSYPFSGPTAPRIELAPAERDWLISEVTRLTEGLGVREDACRAATACADAAEAKVAELTNLITECGNILGNRDKGRFIDMVRATVAELTRLRAAAPSCEAIVDDLLKLQSVTTIAEQDAMVHKCVQIIRRHFANAPDAAKERDAALAEAALTKAWEGLLLAAKTFHEYADKHYAKQTPEGDKKGEANRALAVRMAAIASTLPPAGPAGGVSVSPDLLKPREQQMDGTLAPASGFQQQWAETPSTEPKGGEPCRDLKDTPPAPQTTTQNSGKTNPVIGDSGIPLRPSPPAPDDATPETDKLFADIDTDSSISATITTCRIFARRLERERNAARREVERLDDVVKNTPLNKWVQIKSERDQLRADLDAARQEVKAIGDLLFKQTNSKNDARSQANQLRAELAAAKERADQSEQELAQLRVKYDRLKMGVDGADELRDTWIHRIAREEIASAFELLAKCATERHYSSMTPAMLSAVASQLRREETK